MLKKALLKNMYMLIVISEVIFLVLILQNKLIINREEEVFSISGEAYIVMDALTNEIITEKIAKKPMLTASICKVLTAITAIENLDINRYLLITKEMINVEGSRIYLEENDLVSVKTLLYGLILRSGNDAALSLAMAYSNVLEDFIFKMNEITKKLSLNCHFNNPNGLDSQTKNYASCYDMAVITAYALKNDLFKTIFKAKEYATTLPNGKSMYFMNKHRLVRECKNVIGGKTGYTKKAGRTLITVFEIKNRILIVVSMNAHNDWELHKSLVNYYDE